MKKTNAIRILERNKIEYQLQEYTYDPEDLDVRKIAQDNGMAVQAVYKTLVAKGNKTNLLVAVIPGDKKLDRKAIAKASGNKKINLAPIDKLEELTGYIRGGCSPIGMKSKPPVYIDVSAEALGEIWVNAGMRGLLIKVRTSDLVQVCAASVLSITMENSNGHDEQSLDKEL
ncbi:MAG: Cys-tRNA(Pro) deacylase [Bacteroidota bacterium]